MSGVEIGQADWEALSHKYGEATALLLVYERTLAEQTAELATLRQQLATCVDALHQAPSGEEG